MAIAIGLCYIRLKNEGLIISLGRYSELAIDLVLN